MITEAQLLELLTPGVIGGLTAGAIVILIFVLIVFLLFLIGAYIYYCLVWYNFSKKLKYKILG